MIEAVRASAGGGVVGRVRADECTRARTSRGFGRRTRDAGRCRSPSAALRAAYAAGARPADVVAEAYRRIAALGDPGDFPASDPAGARAWPRPRRSGPSIRPSRSGARPSRSRTTSTWRAVRRRRPARPSRYQPEGDAFVVARLRAAGAIPIGKTNLDQFATGLVGVRTPFPVPRNALDPEIVPGGSSSGSAVAVARGLVSFALGTDTAGSGRVPAALNNIVGLKPSLGALSTRGVVPACRTLDTVSVFALTVADAYAAFVAAAAFDAGRSVLAAGRGGAAGRAAAASGDRRAEPDLAALLRRRRAGGRRSRRRGARLEAGGALLVEIDLAPFYEVAALLYQGPWVAERHAVIEAIAGARPGGGRSGGARRSSRPRRGFRRPTRFAGSTGSRSCAARSSRRWPRSTSSACRRSRPSTPSPISPRTRSGRTRGSGPTPTSSTCSGCAGWRCRRRRGATGGRAA